MGHGFVVKESLCEVSCKGNEELGLTQLDLPHHFPQKLLTFLVGQALYLFFGMHGSETRRESRRTRSKIAQDHIYLGLCMRVSASIIDVVLERVSVGGVVTKRFDLGSIGNQGVCLNQVQDLFR